MTSSYITPPIFCFYHNFFPFLNEFYKQMLMFTMFLKVSFIRNSLELSFESLYELLYFTCFFFSLHDRKMCILGLCALIDLEHRPQAVNQVGSQLLPAAILLFSGLKRAYVCRAEHENDDEDDDEDGEEEDENGNCCFRLGE